MKVSVQVEEEEVATTVVGGGSTGATGGGIKSSSEDELEDATTGVGGRSAVATSEVEFSSETELRRDVEDPRGDPWKKNIFFFFKQSSKFNKTWLKSSEILH